MGSVRTVASPPGLLLSFSLLISALFLFIFFVAAVAVASFFFIVDLALVLEVGISEANWGA